MCVGLGCGGPGAPSLQSPAATVIDATAGLVRLQAKAAAALQALCLLAVEEARAGRPQVTTTLLDSQAAA
jgi:hypothetical protein